MAINIEKILSPKKTYAELASFNSAKVRYSKIRQLTKDLRRSLHSGGNADIGVPGCDFCAYISYSRTELHCIPDCPFGTALGKCPEPGAEWLNLVSAVDDAACQLDIILLQVEMQISKRS